ncbi:hypothetical protein [Conexibacter arvalis]|uniref:Uncharacterized protein n=1 Tax=Conexibacter arvalis TaxID=912552 RepID=A0A840I7X0_9ACTN|nr:hypothetical protein [Conexibacter arvalis]MBB4660612.1 hypothetical protein [Conexibacter arvalis]
MNRAKTVKRRVRSADPSLTPEANRLLTDELREVVGAEEVEVPAAAADGRGEAHGGHGRLLTAILANRVLFSISFAALVTVGVILSLITGTWWALVVACAVHATGTLLIAGFAIHMTTEVEHVDPTTAARLEDEGVGDPDRVLTELTEQFAGAERAHGAADVVSTGSNDNRADPDASPAQAEREQRTAMTPSAHGSSPAGSGSVIGLMPVAVVAGLLVVTLIAAIAEGGLVWAVPAIVWAAATVWLVLVLRVDGPAEERAADAGEPLEGGPDRAHGDTATAARARLLPVVAVAVVGVAGFCVLVALAMTTL